MPIAVLIGTIYALARLAQTSQYTILRTGGLGPGRALWLLASLALVFGAFTFVVGDYVAPISARIGSQLRAALQRQPQARPLRRLDQGALVEPGGRAQLFDQRRLGRARHAAARRPHLRVRRRRPAAQPHRRGAGRWSRATAPGRCSDVIADALGRRRHRADGARGAAARAREWRSSLSPNVVAAAVLPVTTMSTIELWRYIGHLADNEQAAQLQKIQFWNRALYPFVCLVMVGLALPFAYLHARSGGVSMKVFAGIMLGVSFVLLNNVFRHLGLLGNWTPWIVAATPGALYLVALAGRLQPGWCASARTAA